MVCKLKNKKKKKKKTNKQTFGYNTDYYPDHFWIWHYMEKPCTEVWGE